MSSLETKANANATYQPKGDYLTSVPIGGSNIGGVKNGGNVTIESDGTMNTSSGDIVKRMTRLLEASPDEFIDALNKIEIGKLSYLSIIVLQYITFEGFIYKDNSASFSTFGSVIRYSSSGSSEETNMTTGDFGMPISLSITNTSATFTFRSPDRDDTGNWYNGSLPSLMKTQSQNIYFQLVEFN